MLDTPLSRKDLAVFFDVKDRGLGRVLRALDIRLVGGTTRWPVVLRALGLDGKQDPAHWAGLTAPLLTAHKVADLIGVGDPSIVYRWHKGKLPAGTLPFPAVIDLSNGRKNARMKRWRRAEMLAWHERRALPRYARVAPAFGALIPPT